MLILLITINSAINMWYLVSKKIFNSKTSVVIAVTFVFVLPAVIMVGLLGYSFYLIKKLESVCHYTISTKYITV